MTAIELTFMVSGLVIIGAIFYLLRLQQPKDTKPASVPVTPTVRKKQKTAARVKAATKSKRKK